MANPVIRENEAVETSSALKENIVPLLGISISLFVALLYALARSYWDGWGKGAGVPSLFLNWPINDLVLFGWNLLNGDYFSEKAYYLVVGLYLISCIIIILVYLSLRYVGVLWAWLVNLRIVRRLSDWVRGMTGKLKFFKNRSKRAEPIKPAATSILAGPFFWRFFLCLR